jgi:adenylate kinase
MKLMTNNMQKKILVMLGPAGSGKSTQAELISKKFNYKHIIESNILKDEVKKNTSLGKQIKEIIAKGELVPFEVSSDLLFKKIKKNKNKNILIDGFPRAIEQAIILDYFLYSQGYKFIGVIYLSIPKQESTKRLLLRKRADDNPKVIKERLEIYYHRTKEVIERYKEKGKMIEINGNQSIDNVFKEISRKLKTKLC